VQKFWRFKHDYDAETSTCTIYGCKPRFIIPDRWVVIEKKTEVLSPEAARTWASAYLKSYAKRQSETRYYDNDGNARG
jgi:hypothetical protein